MLHMQCGPVQSSSIVSQSLRNVDAQSKGQSVSPVLLGLEFFADLRYCGLVSFAESTTSTRLFQL